MVDLLCTRSRGQFQGAISGQPSYGLTRWSGVGSKAFEPISGLRAPGRLTRDAGEEGVADDVERCGRRLGIGGVEHDDAIAVDRR